MCILIKDIGNVQKLGIYLLHFPTLHYIVLIHLEKNVLILPVSLIFR